MTEEKYNTKDIRHIDEKSQEYIAKGNRMTEDKEFCKFYQKGRKCKLTQDDFRCIENLGGNCASYRYYTFELEQERDELEQENKELKAETLQWKQIKDMANNNKYRSALEEIREIVASTFAKQRPYKEDFTEIETIINEVLQ